MGPTTKLRIDVWDRHFGIKPIESNRRRVSWHGYRCRNARSRRNKEISNNGLGQIFLKEVQGSPISNWKTLESRSLNQRNALVSYAVTPFMYKIAWLKNFSYNNFTGPIPLLRNMSIFSFIGNQGLCGPPLDQCIQTQPSSPSQSTAKRFLLPKYEDVWKYQWHG